MEPFTPNLVLINKSSSYSLIKNILDNIHIKKNAARKTKTLLIADNFDQYKTRNRVVNVIMVLFLTFNVHKRVSTMLHIIICY